VLKEENIIKEKLRELLALLFFTKTLIVPARHMPQSFFPTLKPSYSPAAAWPFFGCFGAVYWKNSFPWLETVWSRPKREASLALQGETS